MIFYVSHKNTGSQKNFRNAQKITNFLQNNDLENTYISPICAFSHLECDEIDKKFMTEIRIDLLSSCDVLLVSSEVDEIMEREIEFAELVGMEVRYLGKT